MHCQRSRISHPHSLALFSMIMLGVGCGVDDDPEVASDGGAGQGDGAQGSDADGGLPAITFHIEFDYRFDDRGFFSDGAARAVLEEAGAYWGRKVLDDFATVPSGTPVRTRDPESPNEPAQNLVIDRDIDDLLIFVGCSDIDGDGGIHAASNHAATFQDVSDPALQVQLQTRYYSENFEPWTGWISFDCGQEFYVDSALESDEDIPPGLPDFWSVAIHEIGHVMGFGTAPHFLDSRLENPYRWDGPASVASYGQTVPLSSSGLHWDDTVISDGKDTLLDPSRPAGVRTRATALDVAVFADLGYQLAGE